MYAPTDIVDLAERYAGARRISTTTVARRANGSTTWLTRCVQGRVTYRSAAAFVQWLSDQWPAGLVWPAHIARPPPSVDSPAATLVAQNREGAGPLAAVEAMQARFAVLSTNGDARAARQAKDELYEAAMSLGPDGSIASPIALCRALGLRISVYKAVVARYADPHGRESWPRAGTASERMLVVLSAAGDVRFASRHNHGGM